MPKISNKGNAMPASPIRKLVPYADAARQKGIKIYHLNIGQPDLETPKQFWDKLKTLDMKVLEYCPSNGIASYRQKFASYYNKIGIAVNADNFMITEGASEALSFVMMTCLDAGDEIIIPEPMYANYIGFASAGNIKVRPISTSIDNGFALPPIDAFKELITPKTKAILICNPNNPTGYVYSKEELLTLREICLANDLYLFVDEVYREFLYGGKTFFSALNLEGMDEQVVVFDSISKRFSACGARIGAIVTRNKQVLNTALKFGQARLSPPSLGQIAAEDLFDLGQDYYDGVVREYQKRRDALVDALNKIPGVKCPLPSGAFYAVAELPVENSDDFCQWMLEQFSYKGATVMMAPASGFYSTPGSGKSQVRIAYVLKTEDMLAAVECLEQGLKAYALKEVEA
ncbi:MAG TPA: pyridoxal phosphate-dependent aminotransferase [Chitinophagales bacterium]|nr:pyridoxal phosphate-dependent aminotransferase [Chitinophagales bacterium]